MKVNLFATFRTITGDKWKENIKAATVEELLEKLCDCYGDKFRKEIYVDGGLNEFVLILINGRAIDHLNGLQTILKDDDEISIFPKIAGG
jgi:molybdopterin synthase sulfur carrier subunit